jgi:hypothetical protein
VAPLILLISKNIGCPISLLLSKGYLSVPLPAIKPALQQYLRWILSSLYTTNLGVGYNKLVTINRYERITPGVVIIITWPICHTSHGCLNLALVVVVVELTTSFVLDCFSPIFSQQFTCLLQDSQYYTSQSYIIPPPHLNQSTNKIVPMDSLPLHDDQTQTHVQELNVWLSSGDGHHRYRHFSDTTSQPQQRSVQTG